MCLLPRQYHSGHCSSIIGAARYSSLIIVRPVTVDMCGSLLVVSTDDSLQVHYSLTGFVHLADSQDLLYL